jgi:hypothetical protein
MKTTTTLTCAWTLGSLLLTAGAWANTARMHNTFNDGLVDQRGGEFRAVTDANGTFYTFCLEREVPLGFTETYTYDISDRAMGANADKHDPLGAGAAGDPLSQGTAYLYEQFSKGLLGDSDGAGSYWDRHDLNAGLLQRAFWTLEDERDFGANPYVSLVKTLFGAEGAYATYTGSSVRVMNLWGRNGRDIQSQLIYVPEDELVYVPDHGATWLFLATGLGFMAATRARFGDRIRRSA